MDPGASPSPPAQPNCPGGGAGHQGEQVDALRRARDLEQAALRADLSDLDPPRGEVQLAPVDGQVRERHRLARPLR